MMRRSSTSVLASSTSMNKNVRPSISRRLMLDDRTSSTDQYLIKYMYMILNMDEVSGNMTRIKCDATKMHFNSSRALENYPIKSHSRSCYHLKPCTTLLSIHITIPSHYIDT